MLSVGSINKVQCIYYQFNNPESQRKRAYVLINNANQGVLTVFSGKTPSEDTEDPVPRDYGLVVCTLEQR